MFASRLYSFRAWTAPVTRASDSFLKGQWDLASTVVFGRSEITGIQ